MEGWREGGMQEWKEEGREGEKVCMRVCVCVCVCVRERERERERENFNVFGTHLACVTSHRCSH